MREVLEKHRPLIERSGIVAELGLTAGRYLLASIHREENVDRAENLRKLLDALTRAADEFAMPVVVSTHPRTRKRLEALGVRVDESKLWFRKPFGFFDYVKLQTAAFCTLSDSGTISEESAMLGFPAITVRNAVERPEAVDAGTIIVTGLEPQAIIDGIRVQTHPEVRAARPRIAPEYEVPDTSLRVLKFMMGHARLSHLWDGIRANDLR
jgi:UDP-N-acetylglucosamine 2-epimerase (non-hydrolysing)